MRITMNDPTIETLARGLDRVERENRRFKLFVLTTTLLVCLSLLMGAKDQQTVKTLEEVRVRRFVVLDDEGKERIVLQVDDHNASKISLLNKKGEQEAILVGGDPITPGGSLFLTGEEGIAYLASQANGPTLRLHGSRRLGLPLLVLRAGKESGMLVSMNEKDRGALVVTSEESRFMVSDKTGKQRGVLLLKADNPPLLFVDDEDKNLRWYAPLRHRDG